MALRARVVLVAIASATVAASCRCGGEPTTGRDGGTDAVAEVGGEVLPDAVAGDGDVFMDAPVDLAADADAYFLFDTCPGPVAFESGAECSHPAVAPECADGWCRIPAGCFLMGSARSEPVHGAYSETQTQVTLTHIFEVMDHEVTQGEWTAAGFPNPSGMGPAGTGACADPDCPLENVTWFEALAFANRMSELHDPPLPACYRLSGCTADVGSGMACGGVVVAAASIYECTGYRLPTVAEHEYATRAGTTTSYYSGPICMVTDPRECLGADPCLEPIGWYCWNSEGRTHRVREKVPNGWGLYDMLGNVAEWVNDEFDGLGYGGEPLVDPSGPTRDGRERNSRGGAVNHWPYLCRAAANFGLPPATRGEILGLRLARTLP
jgi:sulfatase modifying factor 1